MNFFTSFLRLLLIKNLKETRILKNSITFQDVEDASFLYNYKYRDNIKSWQLKHAYSKGYYVDISFRRKTQIILALKNIKMDICNKIDSLFEDKIIQEALKESEILFGSRWENLPSPCSKEKFYQQLPQAPEHAYVVAKVCWDKELTFYAE